MTILAANALTTVATLRGELGLPDASQDDILARLINVASDAIGAWCDRTAHPFWQGQSTEIIGVSVNWPARLQLTRTPYLVSPAPVISTDLDPGPATVVPAGSYFLEDPNKGWIYSRGRWRTTAIRRPDITQDYDPGSEEETVQVVYTGGYVTPAQVDAANASPWPGASQAVALKAAVRPAGQQAENWVCTTAGTTGTAEPLWGASPTVGQTVNDGSVVWTYSGIVPVAGRTLPNDLEQACIDAATAFYRRRGQDLDVKSEGLIGATVNYGPRYALPLSAVALLTPYRKWVAL